MRALVAAALLAGCGTPTPTFDAGPSVGIVCNDGYTSPVCRCTSIADAGSTSACASRCSDAITAAATECQANHGGLDGSVGFTSCKDAPTCL